jgi:CHAT domain-containing protein
MRECSKRFKAPSLLLGIALVFSIANYAFGKTDDGRGLSIDQMLEDIHAGQRTYNSGNLLGFIESTRSILANSELPLFFRERTIYNGLDSCSFVGDFNCYVEFLDALWALEGVGDDTYDKQLHDRKMYYVALTAAKTGDDQILAGFTSPGGVGLDNPFDHEFYIKRQILRAQVYRIKHEDEQAQISLDRALAAMLSIENPNFAPIFIARSIIRIIQEYQYLGEYEKASKLLSINHASLAVLFGEDSFEYLQLSFLRTHFSTMLGYHAQAADSMEEIKSNVSNINVEPQLLLGIELELHYLRAYVCLIQNQVECARESLEWLILSQKDLLLADKNRPIDHRSSFTILLLILNQDRSGLIIGEEFTDPNNIEAHLSNLGISENSELRRGILEVALAHVYAMQGNIAFRSIANSGYRRILDEMDSLSSRTETGFRLISAEEKLLLETYLSMPLALNELSETEKDITFRIINAITSGSRTKDAYYSFILRKAENEVEREKLHSYIRILSRKNMAHIDGFRGYAEKLFRDESYEPEEFFKVDFGRRRYYSDFSLKAQSIRAQFDAAALLNVRDASGMREEVTGLLKPKEAIVSNVALPGGVLSLCYKPGVFELEYTATDTSQLILDYKLVKLALTASHSPSIELDSEYPAASAQRIYNALFKPVDSCLSGVEHVIWLPTEDLLGVPPAALLMESPKASPQGLDLKNASWFLRKASFSVIRAPYTLLERKAGSRKFARHHTFVGIGNPLLENEGSEGERIAAWYRGGASKTRGGFSSLKALPETEEELRGIKAKFPSSSLLLMGKEATERQIRSVILRGSDYISFATHGLMSGEVSNLSEAALVLTPVSDHDSFDDGLLTASEIADLTLNSKLVTLSACNTADYDLSFFQTEVQGLTSAFSIAGIPRAIVTLWPVETRTSEEILVATYDEIAHGELNVSVALSAAQRKHLDTERVAAFYHPRFWSPFTVYGDGLLGDDYDASPESARTLPPSLKETQVTLSEGYVGGLIDLPSSGDLLISRTESVGEGRFPIRLDTVNLTTDGVDRVEPSDLPDENDVVFQLLKVDETIWGVGYTRGSPNKALFIHLGEDGGVLDRIVVDDFPASLIATNALEYKGKILALAFIESGVALVEFDPSLRNYRTSSFPHFAQNVQSAAISVVDEKLVTFVSRSSSYAEKDLELLQSNYDSYHNVIYCGSHATTVIFETALESLLTTPASAWKNVLVHDVNYADGSFYLAGVALDECGQNSRYASIFVSDPEYNIDLLHSETSRNSLFGAIAVKGSKIIAIGATPRSFDVKYDEDPYEENVMLGSVMSSEFLVSGLFIDIDRNTGLVRKEYFRSGADVFFDKLLLTTKRTVIYGTNANSPTLWFVDE